MKTSEVKAALRQHYKASEFALMFEVGNATGTNKTRSADAVAMNLWPSRGLYIEGIEIKVSRSDWRRELDNPAKSAAVQKYCDQWWVVAPVGIVQRMELPPLWGLKEVNDRGAVQTIVKAPKLDPEPVSKGFVAAMLRRASEADASEIATLVDRQVQSEREQIQKRIDSEVERMTRKLALYAEKIEKLKEIGLDLSHPYSSADDIIEAYNIGRKIMLSGAITGINFTADRLESAVGTLREVHSLISPSQESLDNS